MQINNKPSNLVMPFASGGAFNPIPTDSQIATSPNKASYTDGFPPATRTPRAAGGIPPDGLDMNGILRDLSNQVMWQQAAGILPWDSNFASKVGYPLNAVISYNGVLYQSQNDDNKATPTNATAWNDILGNVTSKILALNSPPAANVSMQGINVGANYSNNLTLNFTPKSNGVVVGFAKVNLANVATSGGAVTATLSINGTQLSGDSTVISQSHMGSLAVTANTPTSVVLTVTSGSTAPNIPVTYGVAYIFIPTN